MSGPGVHLAHPDQMAAAAEAVETGGGVLFIVKNYSATG